jgi:cytochrome c oxidase subunit 1
MLVTGLLILIAFPVLTAALIMLYADRHFGTHVYSVKGGGSPVLWQNLFWFFGHPEVYILALPFFGMVSEIFPVFSKKPIFGYKGLVFATLAIAGLSTGVRARHMFTTGTVLLPFFSALSLLIAVRTGIKIFTWIGTMWGGQLDFKAPLTWAVGFIVAFTMGGITGVFLASPPIDFATHDTYFVVAHFHQVLLGTTIFAGFAGFFFWYPKLTGRMYREKLAKLQFWMVFIGFNLTFLPQYLLGLRGMPRRIAVYSTTDHFTFLNRLSTAGAYLTAIGFVVFLINMWVSWRSPIKAPDNPWDGHSLEWATTSPPPSHNFHRVPPIRSTRPTWDMNHPEHADGRVRTEAELAGEVLE